MKPIIHKSIYYKPIEKIISGLYYESIYKPISDILKREKLDNEVKSALKTAIEKGEITYDGKRFVGKFNAKTSKELQELGAKFKYNAWYLSDIPAEYILIISAVYSRYKRLFDEVYEYLGTVKPVTYDFEPNYKFINKELEKQLRETLKKQITVFPELSENAKDEIYQNYNKDMNRYIKGWQQDEIERLRKKIATASSQGYRAETLEGWIQKRFKVSKNKAKFLAFQETSLFTAQFRQQRYAMVGITHYKWATSHDERVRPFHKELDGMMFDFNNPPVTNERGETNNPGQDFNCRCVAIPYIPKGEKNEK
jgi:SPP1 gp7 family putative phage head morphogenesis protein